MDKLSQLALNCNKIDTTLAEEYLKKYDNFVHYPSPGECWQIFNYPQNVKVVAPGFDYIFTPKEHPKPTYLGRKLAKKIEEYSDLLAQIEYVTRKINILDLKNGHIKLLSQHLQCSEASWSQGPELGLNILMDENTPLYKLGCVASELYINNFRVFITATQKTAAVCHIFVEVCQQVGWNIPLFFVNDFKPLYETVKISTKIEDIGCIGVVTETADIDSALDVFINSSITVVMTFTDLAGLHKMSLLESMDLRDTMENAPWRIQKVYIQESIYDEWKGALAAKCSRKSVAACVDAFEINDKLFLCDTFRDEDGTKQGHVIVEAYRTSKELRTLLMKGSTTFLSVWGADSAYTDEIAHIIKSPIVWVNDHANFDGPPQASLPLYESSYPSFFTKLDEESGKKLSEVSKTWEKIDVSARIDVLIEALQKESTKNKLCDEFLEIVLKWRANSFVHVDGGRLCYGFQQGFPNPYIAHVNGSNEKYLLCMLTTAFFNANAIVFDVVGERVSALILILISIGVPVNRFKKDDKSQYRVEKPLLYGKFKVIRTNFGTIFAN